jgi:hypothetical protein
MNQEVSRTAQATVGHELWGRLPILLPQPAWHWLWSKYRPTDQPVGGVNYGAGYLFLWGHELWGRLPIPTVGP